MEALLLPRGGSAQPTGRRQVGGGEGQVRGKVGSGPPSLPCRCLPPSDAGYAPRRATPACRGHAAPTPCAATPRQPSSQRQRASRQAASAPPRARRRRRRARRDRRARLPVSVTPPRTASRAVPTVDYSDSAAVNVCACVDCGFAARIGLPLAPPRLGLPYWISSQAHGGRRSKFRSGRGE